MIIVGTRTSGVRRQMWWKNTRIMGLSAVVGMVSEKNSFFHTAEYQLIRKIV
jgi:hypothetical protein